MKHCLRILGLTVSVVSLGYLGVLLYQQGNLLVHLSWGPLSILSCLVAVSLYLASLSVLCLTWHLLLRAVGEPSTALIASVVFLLSQLAKYLPGNLFQHLGRVALARSHGLSLSGVAFTLCVEMVWVILVGCVLALLALGQSELVHAEMPSFGKMRWRIMVMASIAFLLLLGGGACYWWWRRNSGQLQSFLRSLPTVLTLCPGSYTLLFLGNGLMLDVLARGVLQVQESHVFQLTGFFALAWISGFVTPGAPAGLGVREVVLILTLQQLYGEATAANLAILHRLLCLVGDTLAFCLGLSLKQYGSVTAFNNVDSTNT